MNSQFLGRSSGLFAVSPTPDGSSEDAAAIPNALELPVRRYGLRKLHFTFGATSWSLLAHVIRNDKFCWE